MSGCDRSSDPSGSNSRIEYWTGSTFAIRSWVTMKFIISTMSSWVVQGVNGRNEGRTSMPLARSNSIASIA